VAPKGTLLRHVARDGALVPDPQARLPGRGAYVCGAGCFERARERGGFARALRHRVRPAPRADENVHLDEE